MRFLKVAHGWSYGDRPGGRHERQERKPMDRVSNALGNVELQEQLVSRRERGFQQYCDSDANNQGNDGPGQHDEEDVSKCGAATDVDLFWLGRFSVKRCELELKQLLPRRCFGDLDRLKGDKCQQDGHCDQREVIDEVLHDEEGHGANCRWAVGQDLGKER